MNIMFELQGTATKYASEAAAQTDCRRISVVRIHYSSSEGKYSSNPNNPY